ncbi:Protein of unknown function DUF1722 [Methanococcus vannielii SB]|uniref:DUF1722 domain-containing protein n=1 Tax=Methanococcus vannielii (strain ATCC 35089 / DSM 1224 / JCM 13029 / OCM 148 / SB) TaxID=406327 RepID=A6UP67_METVS|nr:DUF523 and DUF1722 domain-containing protein [Methanococcus vannielii]ABR54289.1 Protein of unknown function DUF1722 [Methanococcus vannielii SB]
MKNFKKPNIIISRCIEHDNCRYDGHKISSDFVKNTKKYFNYITVCPEVEIGLPIPRNSLKIAFKNNNYEFVQNNTYNNYTEKIRIFSSNFLESITNVDGFILKNKSPSCGVKGVKIYLENGNPINQKTEGFFAKEVLKRFPNIPIEDEARLRNKRIKDHFLTKVYTLLDFKDTKYSKSIKELIEFHTKNKLLFMAYNQKQKDILGNIVGNYSKNFDNLIKYYELNLNLLLSRPPLTESNINVLMHIFGYVSRKLSKEEKELFIESLERYRNELECINIPIILLKSWIIRFDVDYLKKQTYFEPFPMELSDNSDLFKRDYWKE